MSLRPSATEVEDLLGALVAIDSVNPSLVPGAAGEGAIASFIAGWLREAGLRIEVEDALPGRPNVIGRLPGSASGRTLILNAHVDTVGTTGMRDPFKPKVEGDRLYGRGAYDMKCGLAAVMLAARALAMQGGIAGDVVVTAVVDEEYASAGTEAVVRDIPAHGAIVTEPTGLRVCAAHKGFAWIEIETTGRAAHGSKPDLGIDAIVHMGRVLTGLEDLGRVLGEGDAHPLLGAGSIHASLIEGGQELSSYPERCVLQAERRTVPGETRETVMQQVESLLSNLHRQDPAFTASARLLFWRDPFEVPTREPIVRSLLAEAADVLGHDPEIYGDTPWMDAALLSAAGITTVVFGPGGTGAHAAEEWASISETAACAEVLARTALRFCAGDV